VAEELSRPRGEFSGSGENLISNFSMSSFRLRELRVLRRRSVWSDLVGFLRWGNIDIRIL